MGIYAFYPLLFTMLEKTHIELELSRVKSGQEHFTTLHTQCLRYLESPHKIFP